MSRTRHTDEQKARIVREFENYQGSTVDFRRQRGISSQTFTNWRRRAETSGASKDEPPAFLEFELGVPHHRPAASGPLVELELGGGIILRIHSARKVQP
jgi:transposase-like protein